MFCFEVTFNILLFLFVFPDQQKLASQARKIGDKSSPSSKTSKPLHPEQPKKKMEAKVNSKSNENGSGEGNRLNRERTKTRTIKPEDSHLMTTLQNAAQELPQDIDPQSTEAEPDYEDDFEVMSNMELPLTFFGTGYFLIMIGYRIMNQTLKRLLA